METLDYIADDKLTASLLTEMRGPDGKPRVLDNVWISSIGCLGDGYSDLTEKTGTLTAGFGVPENNIGPELTFDITLEKLLGERSSRLTRRRAGEACTRNFVRRARALRADAGRGEAVGGGTWGDRHEAREGEPDALLPRCETHEPRQRRRQNVRRKGGKFVTKYEAEIISPAEAATLKRGASNGGYHYPGCAKTFALMGRFAIR